VALKIQPKCARTVEALARLISLLICTMLPTKSQGKGKNKIHHAMVHLSSYEKDC
jgi:hypothetical protein